MIFSVHTSGKTPYDERRTHPCIERREGKNPRMIVWIVMKNGKVDAVFDTEAAAEIHKKNAQRGWNITAIVQKEVYTL